MAKIRFEGQWRTSGDITDGGVGTAWATVGGSYIEAEPTGTAISATFDMTSTATLALGPVVPTIAWQVDGGDWDEADIAASVELATGLTNTQHTLIVILKGIDEQQDSWNLALQSGVAFTGFSITGGSLQELDPVDAPLVHIIGDSITLGTQMRTAETNRAREADARQNWPHILRARMGIRLMITAYSGGGYTAGAAGFGVTVPNTFGFVWASQALTYPSARIVVMALGTNDGVSPTPATFLAAFAALLASIRTAHPRATVLAFKPFISGPPTLVKAGVDIAQIAGDTRIHYVNTTGVLTSTSDGTHPDTTGAVQIADFVQPVLGRHLAAEVNRFP